MSFCKVTLPVRNNGRWIVSNICECVCFLLLSISLSLSMLPVAPAYVNMTGHENMVRSGTTLTLKCTTGENQDVLKPESPISQRVKINRPIDVNSSSMANCVLRKLVINYNPLWNGAQEEKALLLCSKCGHKGDLFFGFVCFLFLFVLLFVTIYMRKMI